MTATNCDIVSNSAYLPIEYISKQFFVGVPVKHIDWKNIFNNMSWMDQERIIHESVNNQLTLKYPVKILYQVAFLKQFLAEMQSRRMEIHDCVYDALGRLMAAKDQENCYKHYIMKENDVITLKENANFISEGTTGLCSWQASVLLAEWCINNANYLKSKNILELGSGIGLVGLTIYKYCNPSKIILSDCHESVLNCLVHNIKINTCVAPFTKVENLQNQSTTKLFDLRETEASSIIEVHRLPWENITKHAVESLNVDIILAADVVYDAALFDNLINGVRLFLNYEKCTQFILACTERNSDTLNVFLKMLSDNKLKYYELAVPIAKYYIWSKEIPIRLFCVKIRK